MVGVPTSNRCNYCKGRRIKCDERWPSCGACQRTKRLCSGPPARFSRFLLERNGGNSTDLDHPTASQPSNVAHTALDTFLPHDTALVLLRKHLADSGGGSFSKFQLNYRQSNSPMRCLVAPEDALATQLIHSIESGIDRDDDIRPRITWIYLLPSRLASSPVLCDAVQLLINTWTNARRGFSFSEQLDIQSYSRCLRSLRFALDDREKAYDANTLAATILIQNVEWTYDPTREANSSKHVSGMCALMVARGPPRGSMLETHICFESLGSLLVHFLINDEPNFFTRSEWLDAMLYALQSNTFEDQRLADQYWLCLQMAHWPDIAKELRNLYLSPDVARTNRLVSMATGIAQVLQEIEVVRLAPLQAAGAIRSRPTVSTTSAYDFSDWTTCQFFINHAMLSIAINRMLFAATELSGMPDCAIWLNLTQWSNRIWDCVPYMETMPSAAKEAFLAPLALSYEAADSRRKEFVMRKILLMSGSKIRFFSEQAERTIETLCKELTGRPSAHCEASHS